MKRLMTAREFSRALKSQFPEIKHVAVFDPMLDEDGEYDPGLVSVLLPPGLKQKEVSEWINSVSGDIDPDFEIELI